MKFRIYHENVTGSSNRPEKNKPGHWRWSLVARNGKIVANSGEGYRSLPAMVNTMYRYVACDIAHMRALRIALENIGRDIDGKVIK